MFKKICSFISLVLISTYAIAQTVTIDESGGWLETAYIKWQPVSGAESYNVYFSGDGITNKKIDDQLIRSYGTYFRADILGLKAGSYTISIAPVISSVEGAATTSGPISVLAHDRSGFAFANGRIPGAYNFDGTPKTGAVILYISENTKNTLSLNVTGANANPCVGLQTILDGFKKGIDNRPLIVRLVGKIKDFSYMLNGDIVIENKNNTSSHITFEGIGDDAVAYGWGIRVKNSTNIEIRNIGTMLTDADEGDNIGLQQNNDYIWVHNVDFFYGEAGGASDQVKGDGALDCKKSTYVTFSYNHFWDSGKSNLLGLSEASTTSLYITYHHNWYDHSDSRHPRVRFYSAHVYNNYFDGISKYGVGSTEGSSIFVENNYFRHCKYPMLTSMQGTDIYYGSPTFSSEDGGTIKSFNNSISGQTRFIPYDATNYPVEFDAYVAATRSETVSNSITSKLGANSYNNFDTDPSLYIKDLIVETPEVAKDKVIQYAGRMNGGDFNWTFNDAVDDSDSNVNVPLKTALTNYTTAMVYIQGEDVPSSQTLVVTTGNASQEVVEGNAIGAIIFTWGGDTTDVNVSGLPASGLGFVKDGTAKTVTITGIPTANVSYYITTVGSLGTPFTEEGTITVIPSGSGGNEIHNFTESGLTSTFFSLTGALSTTKGTVIYNGLTLTQCLKIESVTNISFTTTEESTLTLVFNDGFSGRIKIDGTNYNAINGILALTIPGGSHTIIKTDVANLYYISVVYNSLSLNDFEGTNLRLYPNPITHSLYFSNPKSIGKVQIYNMLGILVKSINGSMESIDMSNLSHGSYLLKVYTEDGIVNKIIIKK
jgi:pectate lyase